MTRNPSDYLNKPPLSFAHHVYHDTTNQQAFAFNGVVEPTSTSGGLGRWSNIEDLEAAIGQAGAHANSEALYYFDGTNSRIKHNDGGPYTALATNPTNIRSCQFIFGTVGGCTQGTNNRFAYDTGLQNAGPSGSELVGLNYYMYQPDFSVFPTENYGVASNGAQFKDEYSLLMFPAGGSTYNDFYGVYLTDSTQIEYGWRHFRFTNTFPSPVFATELAGNLMLALSYDSATRDLTFTIVDIYSQQIVNQQTRQMPAGWTADAKNVAISKKGYALIQESGNTIRVWNMWHNGQSTNTFNYNGGGSDATKFKLNDNIDRFSFITGTGNTNHIVGTLTTSNVATSLTDPQCVAGFVREIGVCERCNPGYSLGAGLLCSVTCTQPCHHCLVSTAAACTKCRANAKLSGTNCVCLDGYYMNGAGNCIKCHDACQTCTGPANTQCLGCSSLGVTAAGNTCNCALGHYASPTQCLPCVPGCSACTGPANGDCTACDAEATNPSTPNNCASCRTTGGGYTWNALAGRCDQDGCHVSCALCNGPGINQCTSCRSHGTGGSALTTGQGACSCRNGWYWNPTFQGCYRCHWSCSQCFGPNYWQCSACAGGFNPLTNGGVCRCANTRQFYNVNTQGCQDCDLTCNTCTGSQADACSSCGANFYLDSRFRCLCRSGYYLNTANTPRTCDGCPIRCDTCTSPTVCTNCITGASQVSGVCQCDAGRSYLAASNTCVLCHNSCLQCTGTSQNDCQTCKPNATRQSNSRCTCNTGFYRNGAGDCIACHQTCRNCSGPNANECIGCNPPAILNGGNCQCGSTTNWYFNTANGQCLPCDQTCRTCNGPNANNCLSCGSSFTLSGNQCTCNSGTYYDQNMAACIGCYTTCGTCSGYGYDQCLSCKSNAFYNGATRQCNCQPGFYMDFNGNCQTCHNSCLTCNGPSIYSCQTCRNNA